MEIQERDRNLPKGTNAELQEEKKSRSSGFELRGTPLLPLSVLNVHPGGTDSGTCLGSGVSTAGSSPDAGI